MSKFTKDQLIARINQVTAINKFRISRDPEAEGLVMDNELFAIALAALTAEPVKYAANGSLFSQIGAAEVAARSYGVPVEPLYHSPIEGLK